MSDPYTFDNVSSSDPYDFSSTGSGASTPKSTAATAYVPATSSMRKKLHPAVHAATFKQSVGAGGIGDLALSYGYQRYDGFAMVITAVTLIILVQGLQTIGTGVARRYRRR